MADEEKEPQTPEPAGDVDTEENDEQSAEETDGDEESPEARLARLDKENESLRKEKDMLHGRATRAEAELKKKSAEAKKSAGAEGATASLDDVEKRIEEKADLRFDGYSKEEIREIETYAKAKGISLREATEQPFVKAAIDGLRSEKRSKEATPSSTRRGQSTVSVDDVAKMKPSERKEKMNFDSWRRRQKAAAGRR